MIREDCKGDGDVSFVIMLKLLFGVLKRLPRPQTAPVNTPQVESPMISEHSHHPPPHEKARLRAWWHSFTAAQKIKKEVEAHKGVEVHIVFGKPLRESLRYANVSIRTANANGELYVWGYIPVVVAKCGLYLKEHATEIEGTFRVNGSNKRMRDLQAIFETPPRYGKELDWKKEHYTVHDVASVFRRYLTQMPEPVIPHDLYHSFRDALANKARQDEVIATYRQLIRSMPPANQYLLLYVLDLLSVFARKADKNLMTAQNLAVIFRPGLISHPNHELSPPEHQLSQQVLEFLIEHQDWFMFEIPAPPQYEPGSPVTFADDDTNVHISSDENESSLSSGWRLVSKPERRQTPIRRTTFDSAASPLEREFGDLSPEAEGPPSPDSQGGVTRRRTLPANSSTARRREGGANVLRKTRRSSSQQPIPAE